MCNEMYDIKFCCNGIFYIDLIWCISIDYKKRKYLNKI